MTNLRSVSCRDSVIYEISRLGDLLDLVEERKACSGELRSSERCRATRFAKCVRFGDVRLADQITRSLCEKKETGVRVRVFLYSCDRVKDAKKQILRDLREWPM